MRNMIAICMLLTLSALAPALPDKKPALRIALVNMKSVYSDSPDKARNESNIKANLKRHAYFIERVAKDGVDFVGFPELSVNGYHFSKTMTWLRIDGPEIKELQKLAVEKRIYISVGIAEIDADGKTWNTQVVIDPNGRIIGRHRKIYLTKEKGFCEIGSEHNVFDVKGVKMGIAICADGSDRKNLEMLVKNGAQVLYGPHANTTGGTSAGWYKFRSGWAGPDGWIGQFKVHAVLHNHAGLYHPDYAPPTDKDTNNGFASGAWHIGPDGRTLAQMTSSGQKNDSKEHILICEVPIPAK